MSNLPALYSTRFNPSQLASKLVLWKTLANHFFPKYIGLSDTVLDVGAGNCELINSLRAKKKLALDLNPDTKKHAEKGVRVITGQVSDLPKSLQGKLDVVILSNFLEHLPTREILLETLTVLGELLSPKGKLLIIQPNINLVKERYWDHIDHHLALNELSVTEALIATDYIPTEVVKRFLPLTVQSKLPVHPILIKLYLSLPEHLRPFAGQSFFVAIRA